MENYEQAIFRTIVYADIFDYPLTKSEIWHYIISDSRFLSGQLGIQKSLFEKALRNSSEKIDCYKKFYFLKNRRKLVGIRLKRLLESRKKIRLAQKITRHLGYIPTIKLIGISGALAMQNAYKDDDIDLFIITSKHTLWVTRFFILALLQFLGVRRTHTDLLGMNKICVNMLVDEQQMALGKNRHDLYTAHEIVQMKSLFERDHMYQRFIQANEWVKKFLPNSLEIKKFRNKDIKIEKQNFLNFFFTLFEYPFRVSQILYMKKRITKEIITNDSAAFHPFDYRLYVLSEYKKRLRYYGRSGIRQKKRLHTAPPVDGYQKNPYATLST